MDLYLVEVVIYGFWRILVKLKVVVEILVIRMEILSIVLEINNHGKSSMVVKVINLKYYNGKFMK
jgi:hypothetical protein